jgi:hypothetical protein
MIIFKKASISIIVFALITLSLNAQQYLDPEYIKVTEERASKIVDEFEISDTVKSELLIQIIAKQYQNLSKIHDEKDAKIETIKASDEAKEKQNTKIDKVKTKADKLIAKLHKSYIKQLSKNLTSDKIDAVKDGMTYGVVPKTFFAFKDMIPSLTEAQKKYIYDNLVEAREHAMDAGTSKDKHAWFGKYKGRINNYLSAQGYDLEKERDGWYERIEARKKNESK